MRNRLETRTSSVLLSPWIRPWFMIVIALLRPLAPTYPADAKQATAGATEPAGLPNRDWKRYPAIVEIKPVADLYALGDAHGDYDRLAELLSAAKLISAVPAQPEAVKWSGGRVVLVCTGDLIDKYPHAMPVIALMRAMQADAEKAGGRVIVTLGNHEAEFLANGGRNKKSAEFEAELTAAGISPSEVGAGRDSAGIGAWLRELPAGAKVGDWFFCHGGNTGGKTLDGLRAELEKEITEHGFSAPILSDPNSMLEARMHPRPWWDAGVDPRLKDIEKEEKKEEKEQREPEHGKGPKSRESDSGHNAAAMAKAGEVSGRRLLALVSPLGAKHLVFGHQPGKVTFADGAVREEGQMFTKFSGLVFMIDTGMSRGVDSGRGAVLRILEGKSATAVYADGKTAVLWK